MVVCFSPMVASNGSANDAEKCTGPSRQISAIAGSGVARLPRPPKDVQQGGCGGEQEDRWMKSGMTRAGRQHDPPSKAPSKTVRPTTLQVGRIVNGEIK